MQRLLKDRECRQIRLGATNLMKPYYKDLSYKCWCPSIWKKPWILVCDWTALWIRKAIQQIESYKRKQGKGFETEGGQQTRWREILLGLICSQERGQVLPKHKVLGRINSIFSLVTGAGNCGRPTASPTTVYLSNASQSWTWFASFFVFWTIVFPYMNIHIRYAFCF